MQVQALIYAYLAICIAMIGFNIVCIFVFRHNDEKLGKSSIDFTEHVKKQLEAGEVDNVHKNYLQTHLKNVSNMIAFDKTLENLYKTDAEGIISYVASLYDVFAALIHEYNKKDKMQSAFFSYMIAKYQVFREQDVPAVKGVLLEAMKSDNLYVRENALQALYSMGDSESIVKAFNIIDTGSNYHNSKLITDGLMSFKGNKKELNDKLWSSLAKFSSEMRVTILNYFRFSSGDYCERIMSVMKSDSFDHEAIYSCIRYFGRYYYEPAYAELVRFAKMSDEDSWEYVAIAATALSNYPGQDTVDLLKKLLYSRNWYVRLNSSASLESLGVGMEQLSDLFSSNDTYAKEIMKYRLDQREMKKREKEVLV